MPPRFSHVLWMISSLGWPTIGLMFVVTCYSLALIWRLYRYGRQPARDVAILLVIPLPLLVGSVLLLGGTIICLHHIASSQPFSSFKGPIAFPLSMAELTAVSFIPVLLSGATALVLLSKKADSHSAGAGKGSGP
jgi:hypothetical protein